MQFLQSQASGASDVKLDSQQQILQCLKLWRSGFLRQRGYCNIRVSRPSSFLRQQ
ncbi:hypothetical protein FOFC_01402 [Fusarium oxysporum]|nr:hypothetical protein FOFC_01402 [Fusarium oxysporum]